MAILFSVNDYRLESFAYLDQSCVVFIFEFVSGFICSWSYIMSKLPVLAKTLVDMGHKRVRKNPRVYQKAKGLCYIECIILYRKISKSTTTYPSWSSWRCTFQKMVGWLPIAVWSRQVSLVVTTHLLLGVFFDMKSIVIKWKLFLPHE